MSSDPVAVVRAFFDRCAEGGQLIAALEEHCAPDFVWENTGLPPAEGLAAAKGFMQAFIDNMNLHALVVDYRAIAADGDAVLTERVDHIDDAQGNRVASLPVSGTLVVDGGKIVSWRDYFDPRPFLPDA